MRRLLVVVGLLFASPFNGGWTVKIAFPAHSCSLFWGEMR